MLPSVNRALVSFLLIFPRQLNIPVSIPNNLSSTKKMTSNNEGKKELGSHLGPGQGEMIWLAEMDRVYFRMEKISMSRTQDHRSGGRH